MTHLTKAYPAKFATLDEKEGRVEALVSIFGNVDLVGDRVVKGAFAKSIEKWKGSGDPIPVVFNHDWSNAWSHIGVVEELSETPEGLKAIYSLDVQDNPVAAQIYKLMKRRSLKEHSFAYEVERERPAKDGANELTELGIIEIGPTLKGVNPATELLAVKSTVKAQERAEKTPPWHVEDDNSECEGFAVVADETSKVVGCHETREAAERQMAALYANVEDADKGLEEEDGRVDFGVRSPNGLSSSVEEPTSSDGIKAGRTISKKTESDIRSAVEILQQVLSSVEVHEEEKSSPEEEEPAAETQGNGKAKVSDDVILRLKAQVVQGI